MKTISFAVAAVATASIPSVSRAQAPAPAAPAAATAPASPDASAPSAPGGGRRVTFEDAIALATAQAPGVAIAAEHAATAESSIGGTKAERLPVLNVHDDLRQFTKEYDIPFQLSPGGPVALFRAYAAFTNTVTVSLSAPLTGQLVLSEMIGAAEHKADAAHADLDKARLDAAFGAADSYMRVLEARAAADVAHKTVAQIEGELERAQKLRAADTYNDIDVLRFKSAKAAADQSAVRADAAAASAIAAFVVSLGLHDGDDADVVDDLPPQAPPLATTIAQAQDQALAARPELHAARERVAAADKSRRASYAGYIPDVRATALYMHNTGFYPFQPDDSAFIGVTASWNVWDWGVTGHQVDEAKHEERAAHVAEDQLVDQVRLDVRKHWLDAKAGYDNLAAADTQLATAEEAYRLQKVRFDAGAATTTDVLDAETDVSRARLAAANARYDYFLGLVALARAVGDLPPKSPSGTIGK